MSPTRGSMGSSRSMRAVAPDGLLTAAHLNSEPINAGLIIAISSTQRRENDGVYRMSFAP
ncbi:hypothetical protein GCM10011487_13470 [Steroidobacter agaridevorans]|uniref:Uncharacterized protein n=1 Tax=Steroidobacter agaridevorans TaxID=2695856 RepID=A0A829Y7V5_9GAMM|nr:hypothetical protein GCM10011487_13470 [Steroidobacter agaridevorans]GFE88352.1 hypothetical protein GCM10011488_33060 [Steroidobacter agaridevorans]